MNRFEPALRRMPPSATGRRNWSWKWLGGGSWQRESPSGEESCLLYLMLGHSHLLNRGIDVCCTSCWDTHTSSIEELVSVVPHVGTLTPPLNSSHIMIVNPLYAVAQWCVIQGTLGKRSSEEKYHMMITNGGEIPWDTPSSCGKNLLGKPTGSYTNIFESAQT